MSIDPVLATALNLLIISDESHLFVCDPQVVMRFKLLNVEEISCLHVHI